MVGRGVGLVELVERAREAARLDRIDSDAASDIANQVARFVQCGQFRVACAMADLEGAYLDHPPFELDSLGRWLGWWTFAESVHLAAQIDDFLAVLEGDERTASLANDCRGELDLLLVLADLCEDQALPRSAKEARYQHRLVESMCVDLWAASLDPDPLPPEELGEAGETE